MIHSSIDEVLDLTGGHPLVRGVGGSRPGAAWRAPDGRTVAFTGLDAEERVPVLVVLGPPDQAAKMALAVRDRIPPDGYLVVPRGTPLPLSATTDWNFRAAKTPPPRQSAEDAVVWGADDEAIIELLKLTSPGSSAWPGDAKVRRWAGVVDGRLLACLADTTSVPGVGHLSAIAVHPDARRRGLGVSITAWAMRKLFVEKYDVVTLGVYADNTAAMRLYDRLGFTVDVPLTSGVLR